jgi:pyruvate dehydrogenase (quinone)/pyruvate oxidase
MQMGDLATLIQEGLPVKVVVFKNDSLGLIKWEQMVFIGNPEYGVNFAPVDFVKVAEACGATAFHIEDPGTCADTLRQALAHPGPVVIEAVVDPNEPPLPAKITPDQAKTLGAALAHGEEHRRRIGLTIGRQLIDEQTFAASPYGVTERVKEKMADVLGRDQDED